MATTKNPDKRFRLFSINIVAILAILAAGGAAWWFMLRSTPPQLQAVSPSSIESGQTVTLTGESFAAEPGGNTVLFGAQQASVTAATDEADNLCVQL